MLSEDQQYAVQSFSLGTTHTAVVTHVGELFTAGANLNSQLGEQVIEYNINLGIVIYIYIYIFIDGKVQWGFKLLESGEWFWSGS